MVLSAVARTAPKLGRNLSGILKTSGGALAGGAGAGYGFASLEQWTGQQDETRRLLVIGGAILLAMYSAGQLITWNVGD